MKHGIVEQDVLHAYRNPIWIHVLDELRMIVGPSRSGELLEIGVLTGTEDDLVIHAMAARRKFLR
jgi:hypothetical protein